MNCKEFMDFDQESKDLADFRSQQRERYGLAIGYMKSMVGEGEEYGNGVARVVVSAAGGYYELREIPEEFSGGLGDTFKHRLIPRSAALVFIERFADIVQRTASGKIPAQCITAYAIYEDGSLRNRKGIFMIDRRPGQALVTCGALRPAVLPECLKVRVDTDVRLPELDSLGLSRGGIVFLIRLNNTDDGSMLLASIHRTPETSDLSNATPPRTIQ